MSPGRQSHRIFCAVCSNQHHRRHAISRPGRSIEEAHRGDLHDLASEALAARIDWSGLHRLEVHSGIPQRARIVALLREVGAPKAGGFGSGQWPLASCIIGNELPVPLAQAVIGACVLAHARVAVQFNRERDLSGYRRVYIGSLASNAPEAPLASAVLRQLLRPGAAPEPFYQLVETIVPF